MASHGGLTATHEAISSRREGCDTHSGRSTIMLVTLGMWIAAAGVVAISLECVGAALVFFGLAALLIRFA